MSVQTEITRISNAVEATKTSIAAKGVEVPTGTKVDGLAALVNEIAGGLEVTVNVDSGSTVTATNGNKTLQGVSGADNTCKLKLPELGSWTYKGAKDGNETTTVTEEYPATIELYYGKTYGVTWAGTSDPAWSRKDDAADFTDPVPYVAGATEYGSPFDDIMPWAGMQRVEDAVAGSLVSIPKFWYKWTQSGTYLTLQISNAEKCPEGFFCSPAHSDRGDGHGERDVVYVARYHSQASGGSSASGKEPMANVTRNEARVHFPAMFGEEYRQYDHAMWMTIMMLYLVEFAHWNSQEKIGYGGGNGSGKQITGASDAMPYHTGTMQTSRTTYGVGCQYRYIEDLWGNVYDWLDGCYYNSNGLNIIKNPANFSDSSNANVSFSGLVYGYPTALKAVTVSGFEYVIIPTASGGSATTYTCDEWAYNPSNPCLNVGATFYRENNAGISHINTYSATGSNAYTGCRLMKLPNKEVSA